MHLYILHLTQTGERGNGREKQSERDVSPEENKEENKE